MAPKPFDSAKLKIARARKHTSELEEVIASYCARIPLGVFVEINNKTGRSQISWRGRENIPVEVSAIAGDIVHNLRSALDLLANDAVSLCGIQPKKVYFPFADTEAGLDEQISSKMKGATEDLKDIVRALKPYKGGDPLLRGLHDLDILDKHIGPLVSHSSQTVTPVLRQVSPDMWVADYLAIPHTPIDMTGYKIEEHIQILGNIDDVPIVLVIAPKLPLEGSPVIETLHQFIDLTQGIVQTFEAHLLGKG